ncbi:synapse differentiation-inducing gene protein 1-like [Ptychodera flava]|uniref:synapse differentiation-inducing gene protein 1-like n=1 Tax=Ptychodera flava TaxID=63121 RepID=UPI00396A6CA2
MDQKKGGYSILAEDLHNLPANTVQTQPGEMVTALYHEDTSSTVPVMPKSALHKPEDVVITTHYHDDNSNRQGSNVPLVTMAPSNHSIVRFTEPVPEDHMALAIFVTICCFWPLGIFAILKARDVHKKTWQRNMEGARQSSHSARQLSLIALGLGISIYVIIVIVIAVAVTERMRVGEDSGEISDFDNKFTFT